MVNQRDRIRLTDDEERELLDTARTIHIASINPDGTPHLVPMWFVVDDDGNLAFTTYARAQKVLNLQRDPRLTLMLETGTAYNELRGMSIDAEAEIVSDPSRTSRVLMLVGAKMGGQPRPDPVPDMPIIPAATKRVTVVAHVRRKRSWDHRKL